MSTLAEGSVVRAAGCAVWRTGDDGALETALVHRPKYDDWSLPKGKPEAGEHLLETAHREVLEETGLHVDRSAAGPLAWTQESTFLFRGERRHTRCHGRVVRLAAEQVHAAPVLTDDEQGSILGLRWWTPQELAASTERFFPRHVPALLPLLLSGQRVDEPFDAWD